MNLLLWLVIAAFWLSLALLFATQIVIPLFKGTPMFPLFRKKTPIKAQIEQAENELAEMTELAVITEKLEEINRRKAELEKK